jgi:protein-disulfide isomerase
VPKVFISGTPDNHPGVRQLVEQLGALGYQISMYPAASSDRQSWDQALRDIADCDVFMPVITPATLQSQSCSSQFDWAERLAKPVLPVLVAPPAIALPARFTSHRIVDYSQPAQPDQSFSMLSAALASLRPVTPQPVPLLQPPPAPRSTRRSNRIWAAVALAAVTVIGLVVWLCIHVVASHANAVKLFEMKDGVFVGSARAATTIDVFAEPICGSCASLANASGTDIRRAVTDKKIAVRYHLLNGEDDQSASGDYSTRAVAASFCVADTGDPDHYQAFYAALFASDFQPKKKSKKETDTSTDRTDADLAQLAQRTGMPSTVSNCITSGQRVTAAKDEASNAEGSLKRLSGTSLIPMIFEGTREVDYETTGWIDNLR